MDGGSVHIAGFGSEFRPTGVAYGSSVEQGKVCKSQGIRKHMSEKQAPTTGSVALLSFHNSKQQLSGLKK